MQAFLRFETKWHLSNIQRQTGSTLGSSQHILLKHTKQLVCYNYLASVGGRVCNGYAASPKEFCAFTPVAQAREGT